MIKLLFTFHVDIFSHILQPTWCHTMEARRVQRILCKDSCQKRSRSFIWTQSDWCYVTFKVRVALGWFYIANTKNLFFFFYIAECAISPTYNKCLIWNQQYNWTALTYKIMLYWCPYLTLTTRMHFSSIKISLAINQTARRETLTTNLFFIASLSACWLDKLSAWEEEHLGPFALKHSINWLNSTKK